MEPLRNLTKAQLEKAVRQGEQLDGANLSGAHLEGANLRDANLGNKHHIGPRLADTQWGTINLAVVDWSQVTKLGDEWEAVQKTRPSGEKKEKDERLNDYREAARANRQLAVAFARTQRGSSTFRLPCSATSAHRVTTAKEDRTIPLFRLP